MNEIKNYGLNWELELAHASPEDWVFGAVSQPGIVSIPEQYRDTYLPVGELQYNIFPHKIDFNDCATRGPINDYEIQFTYHINHEMLPENAKFLRENNYTVIRNGGIEFVEFSDRFIAILSGTTENGNSLKAPIDTIRTCGLIPKSMLPKTDDMTWEQYYSGITEEMKNLGQEFLARFKLNYEKVFPIHYSEVLKDDQVVTGLFAWHFPNSNGIYERCDDEPNHVAVLYKNPAFYAFDNYLDTYDQDFIKRLAPDYNFTPYGYRVYISREVSESDRQIPTTVTETLSKFNLMQFFAKWWELFNKSYGSATFKELLSPEIWYAIKELILDVVNALAPTLECKPKEPIPAMPDPVPEPIIPKPVESMRNMLDELCLAIRDFEGKPGDANYRNNNPGNYKFYEGGYLPKYGNVRCSPAGFAIFPTYELGWLYMQNSMRQKATKFPDWTLADLITNHAPPSDNNPTKRYYNTIAAKLGVSPFIKLRDLHLV